MRAMLLSLAALVCLTGCDMMIAPWKISAVRREGKQPVTCMAGQDCKDKWERAAEWVKNTSKYPITIQTDMLIQTADSASASPDPAFIITKVPAEGNRYTIQFAANCSDIFGCVPPLLKLKAEFVSYMNSKAP